MSLFIPGMAATIAAIVGVSFIGRKRNWFRGLAIFGAWFLPIFFIVDLQYWLYNYGHTMDEKAALNTGDFTPKVFGTTKVWNFHSQTGFEIGFYLMVAAALVITFLPPAIRWALSKRARSATSVSRETRIAAKAGAGPAHGQTA
jgi:hypothetical protein